MRRKKKIGKLATVKLKTSMIPSDTIKKMKRQFTKWEKNICKLYVKGLEF